MAPFTLDEEGGRCSVEFGGIVGIDLAVLQETMTKPFSGKEREVPI